MCIQKLDFRGITSEIGYNLVVLGDEIDKVGDSRRSSGFAYLKRLLSLHFRHLHNLLLSAHANLCKCIQCRDRNQLRQASNLFVGFVADTQLQVIHDSLEGVGQHLGHAHIL